MKNDKKLLLFSMKEEKRKQIEDLCRKLQIQAVTVAPKQYAETLGALAGVSGIPGTNQCYQGPAFPMEMMVFSGISSEQLDEFLKQYRMAEIERVPLKAIVTPYNIFWNAEKLYGELLKEHKSLQ